MGNPNRFDLTTLSFHFRDLSIGEHHEYMLTTRDYVEDVSIVGKETEVARVVLRHMDLEEKRKWQNYSRHCHFSHPNPSVTIWDRTWVKQIGSSNGQREWLGQTRTKLKDICMRNHVWSYQGTSTPNGEKPLEDGGMRTDAPTSSQLAFHVFCSNPLRRQWRIRSFVSTAFLHGDTQTRDIYCQPPKDGLPGVHPDSLLQVNIGVYGLREAPRLWYLKANRILRDCGWEGLEAARSCNVLLEKKDKN